jgi:hypothetical protein
MVTVPVAARSFDKGRAITPLEHLIEDFRLRKAGNSEQAGKMNRQHFAEWLRISAPRVAEMRGEAAPCRTTEEMAAMLEEMSRSEGVDIHYHAFSKDSFSRLVRYFAESLCGGKFTVAETCSSRAGTEVVAVLRKCG